MAIHYRQILELHAQELVQRDIAAITGNSRPKISEVIKQAELHQISPPFTDDVDDIWLESLLFPQKQPMAKGRQIPDFEKIHEELAKPNVTLSLVHYESWIIHRISKKQRNPTIHTGLRCFGVSPIGCAYMLRLSR